MATFDVPRVIRRVRQKLGLSQEGLSRRLGATKGAIQHWERGRNQPDLARLFVLRDLCPSGAERKEVEGLIRHIQGKIATPVEVPLGSSSARRRPADPGSQMLLRENARLRRQIERLEITVRRRAEQLRILEDLAADLQRQVAEFKAVQSPSAADLRSPTLSSVEEKA
jgi:transcriptional regulator with XRE-family HTH domain